MAYRLAILTPTCGKPHPSYVQSIWDLHEAMRFDTLVDFDKEQSVMYRIQEGSVLPQNRESLIIEAARNGATHALFIDDDVIFDFQALRIMANRRLPLVAANYPRRSWPPKWTAMHMDGSEVLVPEESTGLIEADYAGLGFTLIDLEIMADVALPWFEYQYKTPENAYIGEDVSWFRKARAAGYPCMIDLDASKRLVHVGAIGYTWKMFQGRGGGDSAVPNPAPIPTTPNPDAKIDPRKADPMTLLKAGS